MSSPIRLAAVMLTAAAPAFAQTPYILDQNRPDRVQPVQPVTPKAGARTEAATKAEGAVVEAASDAGAAPIREIKFIGSQAPQSAADAARPFIGKMGTPDALRKLAEAISSGYAKADVALYTVLIPQQDLSTGVVRVLLNEGTVERVIVTDTSTGPARKLVARIAAHLQAEHPLRRSTLQRYLSLIPDLPGPMVKVDVVQGSRRGLVRIVLTVTKKKNDLGAGYDNRSGATYRHGEFSAAGHFFGAITGGDQLDLSAAASLNFKEYRYVSAAYGLPIGSEGGRFSLSAGYLTTKPRAFPIEGNAKIAGVTYSYPIVRDFKRNLTVSATFDGLNSDNAAFGRLIARERTRAARVALGFVEVLPRRTLNGGITVSKGVDALGAEVTAPLSDPKFVKVNARANVDQAVGKIFVARLRLSGQYSRDDVPAAERFAVGGEDFGRAFEVGIVTADRGAAGLFELAAKPLLQKKSAFKDTEVYAFVDGAKVRILDRGPYPGAKYDLASAGFGARIAYTAKAALFLEGAKPLNAPYPGYGHDWRFNLGWRLSLKR